MAALEINNSNAIHTLENNSFDRSLESKSKMRFSDGLKASAHSTMSGGDYKGSVPGGTLSHLSDLLTQNMKLENLADLKGNLPTIPINDLRGEEATICSRDECALRRSLAALYRLIDTRGWTHSIYNHISVRSSDNPTQFLINPFGLLYHEVQASSLVKIDEEGTIVQQGSTVLGVNKAAWTLHSALHAARPDVNCIIHVHVPDVIAVSCIRAGLLPVSPEANELLFHSGVRYHDYRGILVEETERSSIQTDLGPKAKVLFLRNHGVAIAASSISESWYLVKRVVAACQTQMRMLQLSGGAALLAEMKEQLGDLSDLADSVDKDETNHEPMVNGNNGSESGGYVSLSPEELEFEAEMRVLDSAGFRTGHTYRQPNLLRHAPVGANWGGDTIGDQATGAELLTTDFSATECSAMDDVAAAEAAGAQQVSRIADHVRANKQKSLQRSQWLSRGVEENDTGVDAPSARLIEAEFAPSINRSATLPASAKDIKSTAALHTNTLHPSHGTDASEDEEPSKSKKKPRKFGSFRMLSFSKKKKT